MVEILSTTLRGPKLWNSGILLIMGNAGFISSTVSRLYGFMVEAYRLVGEGVGLRL